MNPLDTARHVEATRAVGAEVWRMAENRLDAAVPACPEWRIRDVVHHLGNVASFIRACVEQGVGEPEFTDAEMRPDERLIEWAAEEWDRVLDRLAAADPLAAAWNWSTQPHIVAFWPRCLTHEAFVHGWDIADAVGESLAIPAEVAADGVDEILAVHLAAGVRDGRRFARTGRIEVHSTDTGDRWLVETAAASVRTRAAAPGESCDARIAATAEDLYLDLWGRTRLPLDPNEREWADQLAAG
ncbi:maleylpyruvate isomerase family mycothiol-dependent enzyme [Saccharopolyspora sp. WRP15-2]|uniref:Maleylpyruvate isomerase family mycothiol-dependent enzyme n=1 Tax=Saccharopolyspora oryzae TaxID=2997343 RepID=A0ABT4UXN5_9PSEU|nr:maleylpyruvate isomerase family mycothiol-dependent enzyme [Saccharopolyspora oryzae]MDA3626464.1 maleylpyruvate isomerase family mycothiol-dependent enzyme [Saccharopolyspora oryzae]